MPTTALDRLVIDGKIAPGWPAALRGADAKIDAAVDRTLAILGKLGPYIPDPALVWRVYEMPLNELRVLIVGQDPYPNESLATGLSFSTGPGGLISDSLRYVFNELDCAVSTLPSDGDLSRWTSEGVFLLNRALTLPQASASGPRVHFGLWSRIHQATLRAIAHEGSRRPIAALLWGAKARHLRKYLEPNVRVFASSHPSPRSAAYDDGVTPAFVGSNPFSAVNGWLVSQDPPAAPINWELVP